MSGGSDGRRVGRRPGSSPATAPAILAAARAVFAGHGYDGESIRAVAAAAWVDTARRAVSEPTTGGFVSEFVGMSLRATAAARLLDGIDPAEARRRPSLVMRQMLGLVTARRVLMIEPIPSMPVEEVAHVVAPTIARYLGGELTTLAESTKPTVPPTGRRSKRGTH
jgi:Tetracyclin repressor-like, C-terminal domain/Bacterial regulatory proteins, tetR family